MAVSKNLETLKLQISKDYFHELLHFIINYIKKIQILLLLAPHNRNYSVIIHIVYSIYVNVRFVLYM